MTVDMSKRIEARMKILEEVYANVSVSDTICTSDADGEFILSSSDSMKSAMEKHTITINNIRDLKTVAGNPNELHDMNLLSYPAPIVAKISDRKDFAEYAKEEFREKWDKRYPNILKSWDKNWAELTAFF